LIFRELCSPESLGLKQSTINVNNPVYNQDSMDNENGANENRPFRYFNYKKFVLILSYFRKKDQQFKILYKLDTILKERGLTYKQVFRNFNAK
jgi:hypothetical protein